MNKIKFLVFTFFLTFIVSFGQQKEYTTYKVKKGETIKGIAKRLKIRTKDLLKLNPDVGRKPKENAIIIIPNPEFENANTVLKDARDNKGNSLNEVEGSQDSSTVLDSEDLITTDTIKVKRVSYEDLLHTVKPKETVYSLTKHYRISKEELIKLNPEFSNLKKNELSIGQVLKVGSKEVITMIPIEEDLKNYVTHVVKPKETVYGLTRFYNITKEELVSLNPESPEIKNNALQIGQVIRIRSIDDKIDTDDVFFYQDSIADNASIKLGVILPFKAKEYDSISSKDIFKGNRLANMVTDFYMGLEVAVDSIKQQGVSVDVSVFDSGNRGSNIKGILEANKLDSIDVIIGPFYSNKVEMIASNVKSPVVFPHFSKKQNEFTSNKIVKAEPDVDSHTRYLSSYLKEVYNGETIFVVGDGKAKSDKQVKNLVSSLKKHDSINNIIVLKPEDGYIKKTRFTDKMKPNTHNWLIMASDDNAVVADALNSMIVLPKDVTGQVFSIRKNKAYNNIDNNKLARVDFAYATGNYTDEKSIETKVFNRKYKKINNEIPSEYAVKGFDVTYDILIRLASGNELFDTFKKGASLRLETKFNYENKLFGAKSNKGLFIVKYNKDLSLKRLK